jgi:hypothetical protein
MPETVQVAIDDGLRADLDAYFAVTTAAEMPTGVATISSASLQGRHRPWWPRAMRPATALVGAAVVVAAGIAVTRGHGSSGTTASESALSAGAGSSRPAATSVGAGALITYPGVDGATVRATFGITFLDPSGHGGATVSTGQARAVAVASVGAGRTAGAAVLTWAELTAATPPSTCLCWVVDVVAAPGSAQPSPAATSGPSVLVLVDATTDVVILEVSGPGIR